MLLTADNTAKIGDVGLARFMPNDYMSTQAAIGETLQDADMVCASYSRLAQAPMLSAMSSCPHHGVQQALTGDMFGWQALLCGPLQKC